MNVRQAFTRKSAESRRETLVQACGRCLNQHGAQGTSVRTICREASVSPGLLRHYFDGIDSLIEETYRATGRQVADALAASVATAPAEPRARLLAFITASFRPPISDPELLATWLAFWSLARTNPTIGKLHDEIYAENRREMEKLISACPEAPAHPRLTAIALTALVDGLWLELSLGNAPFTADEAGDLASQWLTALVPEADRP